MQNEQKKIPHQKNNTNGDISFSLGYKNMKFMNLFLKFNDCNDIIKIYISERMIDMIHMQKQKWIGWLLVSFVFSTILFLLYTTAPSILQTTEFLLSLFAVAASFSLFLLFFTWISDKENRKAKLIKEGYVSVGANGNGETYWVRHYERVVMVCTVDTKDYVVSRRRYEKSELETLFSLQDKIR